MTSTTFTFSSSPFTDTSTDTFLTSASYNDRTNELTGVVIGTLVTSLSNNCFYYCPYLTNATISNTVESIGDYCFSRTSISSIIIPSSVTTMGEACFSRTNISSIVIPSSVTTMGDACFATNYQLTSVEIPNSITNLSNNCFYDCTGLTTIVIPDSVITIGNNCFSNCLNLSSVTIPTSVTSLGNYCFNNCTALITINIPNSITLLGNFCFNNCTSLETVNLTNSITSLGEYCFANCASIVYMIIPSFVASLGSYCFVNCYTMSELQFNNPKNLTSIGVGIFNNIPNAFTVSYYNVTSYYRMSDASKELQTQMPSGMTFDYYPKSAPPCFNKGTQILIFDTIQLVDKYVPIEQLKVGDLVKTYRHGNIPIKHINSSIITNNPENKLESMFKHNTTNLIVTGGHSILTDKITKTQQNNMLKKWKFSRRIENKYCLLACVSPHFTQIIDNNEYEIYHLVLDSKIVHFGIYAEEILTESCSEKAFLKFFTL